MPVLNEAEHLSETLASVSEQSFDKSRLFFIAVDGGSTDGSRQIIESWLAAAGIEGRLVSNPRRRIASSLNIGLRQAKRTDIIVRLDAHTAYGKRYVAELVAALEGSAPTVGCVGGAQIPALEGGFQRNVVGALLVHPLGLARLGVCDIPEARSTETVYLGAWKPGVLSELGGFDEGWVANEDSELEARLRGAGWTMLLVPARSCYRVNRGIVSTVKQWGNYGFWRAQTTLRYPTEFRPRHAIPPALVIGGAAIALTRWRLFLLLPFSLYAAGVVRWRGADLSLAESLACAIVFPAVQAAWTIGFLRGLLNKPAAFRPADLETKANG